MLEKAGSGSNRNSISGTNFSQDISEFVLRRNLAWTWSSLKWHDESAHNEMKARRHGIRGHMKDSMEQGIFR